MEACVLKLQCLKSEVPRTRGNFTRRKHVARHWHMAFKIVHVPDFFVIKLRRLQV
jgi:hypothetical protein